MSIAIVTTNVHRLVSPPLAPDLKARFERDITPLLDRLYARARRLTCNEQDAEDLMQEAVLHAYKGFRSFRDGTNQQAWLFRILHNIWVSEHRKKSCRPTEVAVAHLTDRLLADSTPTVANTTCSAERIALEALPDKEIQDALLALSEAQRMTVYYADVEGRSYKDIANIMNVPVATVMSRLHRGRRQLRTNLLELAEQV